MIAAPTFSQIRAQVDAILTRSRSSRDSVIGIQAEGRWTGDREQQKGGWRYLIDQCDSPLEIRLVLQSAALQSSEKANPPKTTQVIITPLAEADLEEDIRVRLAKQRLFTINPWEIVKSLFNATRVDPRLIEHKWLPSMLIEEIPEKGYAPALGGFLDAEVIWPILLHRSIGLRSSRPTLASVLEWSTDPDKVAQYQHTSDEFRAAAVQWLSSFSGAATSVVLRCVGGSQAVYALPLGLAAQVIYHPQSQGKLDKAIGKLEERFLAGYSPSLEIMRLWAEAARKSLDKLPVDKQQALILRSDRILSEIGADNFAHLSDVSEYGYNQQLTDFAEKLAALIEQSDLSNLNRLLEVYQTVKAHYQSTVDKNQSRLARIEMATRLSQWITSDRRKIADPDDLEAAIAYHLEQGSFLDWARLTLPTSEPNQTLSAAYRRLFDAVTAVREQQAHQFATLLKNWVEVGSTQESVLPIEDLLAKAIAPLAEKTRVLLVVLDGMSVAVCQELLSSLKTQSWQLAQLEDRGESIRLGLAALPSVTATSRTSLFCGKLQRGEADREVKGFSSHSELLRYSKRKFPPLLFHKASLQSGDRSMLSEELMAALTSEKQQIVGLVLNAIDDLLSKGDQVETNWTFERIKLLQPVLQMALDNDLCVVLASDHGHILENGTTHKSAEGGERWRIDDSQIDDGELRIEGDRVLTESGLLVAPWTEKIRYSSKKNGYHGSINPQEMLVPVAVLFPVGKKLSGWRPVDNQMPAWWETLQMPGSTQDSQFQAPSKSLDNQDFGPLFQSSSVPTVGVE